MPRPSSISGSLAGGLDYELGKDLGLARGNEVPVSVVQSVIQAADQGNRGIVSYAVDTCLSLVMVSPLPRCGVMIGRRCPLITWEALSPAWIKGPASVLSDGIRRAARSYYKRYNIQENSCE